MSSLAPTWATFVPELLSQVLALLLHDFEEWKAQKEAGYSGSTGKLQRQRMPRHPLLTATHVNRHWNGVATRDLYSRIYVHKLEVVRPLLKAVTANPKLLDHIKSLNIDYKYVGLPTQPKAAKKEQGRRQRTSVVTWQLLRMLKPGRLRHLSIEAQSLLPFPADYSFNDLIQALIGLKSLAIVSDGYLTFGPFLHFAQWVAAAAPTLERLSLPCVWSSSMGTTQNENTIQKISGGIPNLKSVCIIGDRSELSAETFDILVTAPARAGLLEDLSLPTMFHCSQAKILHVINRAATTLRRLHLNFTWALYSTLDSNPGANKWTELYIGLQSALPTCKTLEVMQIEAHLQSEDYMKLIQSLPPSVKILRIGRRNIHGACTIEELANALAIYLNSETALGQTVLPTLATVQLVHYVCANMYKPTSLFTEADTFKQRGIELTFDGPFPEHLSWSY
ncbi:hypothetical protein BKA62DRAFT_686254 [Auriculariales sp. MPI-PUGE-AT-0066]|nr:hypothetical protein BKA62DRAFT_686254 [Auriculariales sp. MPI-PUGE-AT-0066]